MNLATSASLFNDGDDKSEEKSTRVLKRTQNLGDLQIKNSCRDQFQTQASESYLENNKL